MDDELYDHIKNLSDEELLNIVDGNSDDFTEEAIETARKEAEARGGTELLYKKIEEQMDQVRLENEDLMAKDGQVELEPPNDEPKLDEEPQSTIKIYRREQNGYHQIKTYSGSRTIKEETILDEWSTMVDNAAGNAQTVLDDIQRRLRESEIPGGCTWSVEEVKSSTFLSRVKREFLIVYLDKFKDYHMYISIRDYGVHLDCCRFLTVEPNFLKKWASIKLTGNAEALSAPKNILIHQDLRAWKTVVHYAVLESVEALMTKLGKNTKHLQRSSKGLLEIW